MILFFLIIMNIACSAQYRVISDKPGCTKEYDSILKHNVYTWVDEMPQYLNGIKDMLKYFTSNYHTPNNSNILQGTVKLEFIVTDEGILKNINILNKKPEELTEVDKEAIRVFSSMPKWNPGKCRGIKVPVKMIIPIRF